ncbi:hypothetical protein ACI79D_16565 [Geodermatophilus sp. SYSU D00708]
MDADSTCPRALLQRDARALIGLLAVVEGQAMAGTFDPAFVAHLARRFASAGLLPDGATDRDVRQVLNDLNHRVRYSLGERDDPPQSVPVP